MAYYSDPSPSGNASTAFGIANSLFNQFRKGGGIDQQNAALQGQKLANVGSDQANQSGAITLAQQKLQQGDVLSTRDAMNAAADEAHGLFAPQAPALATNPDGTPKVAKPFAGIPLIGSLQMPQPDGGAQPPLLDRTTAPFFQNLPTGAPGSPEAAKRAKILQYFDKVPAAQVPAAYNQLLTSQSGRAAPPVFPDAYAKMLADTGSKYSPYHYEIGLGKEGTMEPQKVPNPLQPEQVQMVLDDPVGAPAHFHAAQQPQAAELGARITAQRKEQRDQFASNPDVVAAYGTKEQPGMLRIKGAMDTITAPYTDPATGTIDWDKLKNNGPASFGALFSYLKGLSPNSIVRPSELQEFEKLNGAVGNMSILADKILHGAQYKPEMLQNMYSAVSDRAAADRENLFNVMNGFEQRNLNKQNPAQTAVTPRDLVDDPRLLNDYGQWKTVKIGPTVQSMGEGNALPAGTRFNIGGQLYMSKGGAGGTNLPPVTVAKVAPPKGTKNAPPTVPPPAAGISIPNLPNLWPRLLRLAPK